MAARKPSETASKKSDSKDSAKKTGDKSGNPKFASKSGGGETPIHTVRVPNERWEAAKRLTKGTEDGVSGVINQALRKKTGK